MKVFNLIWGFSTGGIGKCFLTYASLGGVNPKVEVTSVCIDIQNREYDRKPLHEIDATLISIKHSFDISWITRLARLIKEEKPDLIFCHGFNGPVVVLLTKLFYGIRVPMVCSYHGIYHAPTGIKKIIAPLYNGVQIFCYKKYAERVITVEKNSLKYLESKGVNPSKLMVVHNGIIDDSISNNKLELEGLKSEGISVGVVSRLVPIKGLVYLIKAITLIKEEVSTPFKLFIIGDGPEEETLKTLVQSEQITDLVHFVGYQSNIQDWLNSLDVFVLSSLHECHSISLLEAMRASKAIVATDVGGNTESVRDGLDGLIVPAKNPKELADAIVKLMKSEELRITLGESARNRFLNEFTEDIMKNKLVKALTLN